MTMEILNSNKKTALQLTVVALIQQGHQKNQKTSRQITICKNIEESLNKNQWTLLISLKKNTEKFLKNLRKRKKRRQLSDKKNQDKKKFDNAEKEKKNWDRLNFLNQEFTVIKAIQKKV